MRLREPIDCREIATADRQHQRRYHPYPKACRFGGMRKLYLTIFMILALAVAGGGVFLATWDIPPPASSVERVLPDDRFPQ
jgi:hypothetical protein